MLKRLVLTNIFSICLIFSGLKLVANENITEKQTLMFLLLVIAYIVLNLTMLILNEIQKKEMQPQEYKYSLIFYLFNLIYPIFAIIIS